MQNPLDILKHHFGFSSFRPGQQEAITALLKGHHTLVVMPTGAGKSLIFQLSALLHDGLTLVVSPLIALMKDQVDGLTRLGIPATYINSTLPVIEQNTRLKSLMQGQYRLVYIAPERLRNISFMDALASQRISLLAVDEAHCILEWGHDFRPDYLYLPETRRRLGNPLTVALTATATPHAQSEIIRLLGLEDAVRIITGYNRPNVYFEVRYVSGLNDKLHALSELVSSVREGAVIIYTGTRRDAEEVCLFLREVLHLPAEFYHAGLTPEDRMYVQNEFIAGRLNFICTTKAFGMGIDRADVRHIIHYSLPASLEAYYQEVGRAGRDGNPARATLLYDPEDRVLQEHFITNSDLDEEDLHTVYQSIDSNTKVWMTEDELSRCTGLHPAQIRIALKVLEHAGVLERLGDEGIRMLLHKRMWSTRAITQAIARHREHLSHRIQQLDKIVLYAETSGCRRRVILQHFGDTGSVEVDQCCDNCSAKDNHTIARKHLDEMTPGERAALIVLDCVRLARTPVGQEKLAQILHGSQAKDISQFHHNHNRYYGRLAALRKKDIKVLITQLIQKGYLKKVGSTYPVLVLTPQGENALHHREAIALDLPKSFDSTVVQHNKAKQQAGGTVNYTAQLLAEGLSVARIAQQRQLSIDTIYTHCVQLIERGMLELERVVPVNVQSQIEAAIKQAGATSYQAALARHD